MNTRAAVINAHYAHVHPQGGGYEVAVLSREQRFPVSVSEKVLIAKSETDAFLRFQSYGQVEYLLTSLPLKKRDLAEWPNKDFADRYVRDLRAKDIEGKPILIHRFRVGGIHPLEGPNTTLDRLAYSLKGIERFDQPIVHFQQQVRNLEYDDFETIQHGWVYIARTAFAKVANALPLRNRLEFRLWMDKEFGVEPKTDIDYVKYFDLLFDYLEARIFSRGRLLIATDELIHHSAVGILPKEHRFIGLADEEGHVDSIHEQANRFRLLFEKGKPELLRDLNTEVIKDPRGLARFKRVFRNKPLPLDLTD